MGLFTFHIHNNINTKKIMSALEDIKARLALQEPAIEGLQADLDFIKAKLAGAEGGLTAAEVAELITVIDARTQKLNAMDAQTDSSGTPPTT